MSCERDHEEKSYTLNGNRRPQYARSQIPFPCQPIVNPSNYQACVEFDPVDLTQSQEALYLNFGMTNHLADQALSESGRLTEAAVPWPYLHRIC